MMPWVARYSMSALAQWPVKSLNETAEAGAAQSARTITSASAVAVKRLNFIAHLHITCLRVHSYHKL